MKKTLMTVLLGLVSSAAYAVSLTDAIIEQQEFNPSTLFYSNANGYSAKDYTMMIVLNLDTLNTVTVGTSNTHFLSTYSQTSSNQITSTNYGYSGLGLKMDNNGNYIATAMAAAASNYTPLTLGKTGQVVLTLAVGDNNNSNPTSTYVFSGGTDMPSVNHNGLRYSTTTYSVLFLNADMAKAVDSFYLFNDRLTTDTIKTLSVSALAAAAPETMIPEPATATLSLLALAGLAARRRRK